jgi:protein-disulfide isomerase
MRMIRDWSPLRWLPWRGWLMAGLLAVFAAGAVAQPATRGSFTPAQRQEIVDIIREALRTDPSLLRDAISALQEAEEREKATMAQGAIGELGQALTRNPADPVAGNPKGDVTLVEFYDARCPYCRRMLPVLADLVRRDPNVRIVYKDFPILGPASTLAARALLAAQKQDGYFKLHNVLMTGASPTDMESIRAAAGRAGLDWEKLQRDMGDPEVQARLTANLAMGRRLGIQGTPAYVVGNQILPGAVGVAELMAAVSAARTKAQ